MLGGAIGGGVIAFTLMACYGRPPCPESNPECYGPPSRPTADGAAPTTPGSSDLPVATPYATPPPTK
jgi:hypothetical protein